MDYFNLPKIDLHCHLDGSVRPQTILDLAKQQNIALPSNDISVIKDLMIAPETCPNLDEYLKRFELPLSVMQTAESLERISFELYEDAAKENVKYLEVRFGPMLHLEKGLTLDQIMNSVIQGMRRAEASYDIKGNYILSLLRHMPKETIKPVIDAGEKYLNDGVVGFDLAGGEAPGFCEAFIPYAEYAADKGYRITIHAGEQGSGQNVNDAVSLLGAERIGHGIHIENDAAAYEAVRSNDIALETCPSSNVQTKAVNTLKEHPIKAFYQEGILVTINTDNRTVSNTTMTDEVRKVIETFDLTLDDYYSIYKISVAHAFASKSVKQHLLQYIE